MHYYLEATVCKADLVLEEALASQDQRIMTSALDIRARVEWLDHQLDRLSLVRQRDSEQRESYAVTGIV